MQVWVWIYGAMRVEKSIDTLFILRTDERFMDWKENRRCGRQSLSLASLDSSLYTREPDPSVGCADSSPDKGSQWAVGDAGPYELGQKCSPLFTGFFAALRMTANFEALRATARVAPTWGTESE